MSLEEVQRVRKEREAKLLAHGSTSDDLTIKPNDPETPAIAKDERKGKSIQKNEDQNMERVHRTKEQKTEEPFDEKRENLEKSAKTSVHHGREVKFFGILFNIFLEIEIVWNKRCLTIVHINIILFF